MQDISDDPPVILPGMRRDWLAQRREPALEPDLPIIDPHHHLWGPPRQSYLAGELLADISEGHDIRATVFVQCRERHRTEGPENLRPVGEAEFAAGVGEAQDASDPDGPKICAGIVSFAQLKLGAEVREVLEAHIEAGNGRFRGIRQSAVFDPSGLRTASVPSEPGILLDPKFREGFAELAPAGLSYDSWAYFHQMPELTDLARAFPETTIIMDHVGGVLGIGPYAGRRDEIFAEWARNIDEIAKCPNVSVKLGGLGMHTCGFGFHEEDQPPSSETLAEAWRPYLEHCIDRFGVERAMYESNFPVDGTSCSYGILWNAFKRVSAGASADEKAALFHDTAARVYRLDGL